MDSNHRPPHYECWALTGGAIATPSGKLNKGESTIIHGHDLWAHRKIAQTINVYLPLLGSNPDHRLAGNVTGLRQLF